MLNRFKEWCLDLEPGWVGFLVFLTVSINLFMVLVVIGLAIGFYTKGWVTPILVGFLFTYAWYIALFKQP